MLLVSHNLATNLHYELQFRNSPNRADVLRDFLSTTSGDRNSWRGAMLVFNVPKLERQSNCDNYFTLSNVL